jgi:hypothetical protein
VFHLFGTSHLIVLALTVLISCRAGLASAVASREHLMLRMARW